VPVLGLPFPAHGTVARFVHGTYPNPPVLIETVETRRPSSAQWSTRVEITGAETGRTEEGALAYLRQALDAHSFGLSVGRWRSEQTAGSTPSPRHGVLGS
jgi:hypothetical protein